MRSPERIPVSKLMPHATKPVVFFVIMVSPRSARMLLVKARWIRTIVVRSVLVIVVIRMVLWRLLRLRTVLLGPALRRIRIPALVCLRCLPAATALILLIRHRHVIHRHHPHSPLHHSTLHHGHLRILLHHFHHPVVLSLLLFFLSLLLLLPPFALALLKLVDFGSAG